VEEKKSTEIILVMANEKIKVQTLIHFLKWNCEFFFKKKEIKFIFE